MEKIVINCIGSSSDTIHKALQMIEENSKEILVVLDDEGRVTSTITDGDIRRALIAGCSMQSKLSDVIAIKSAKSNIPPITASFSSSKEELLNLMKKHLIRQIPLVDNNNVFHSLALLSDLLFPEPLHCAALIVAGGFGLRLRPLTEHTPKPMLPVGNRPLIQLIVDQLVSSGVRDIFISTHYMTESIANYFKTNNNELVSIKILNEDKPMGTAGSIGLISELVKPLFIINGDILSRINLGNMYEDHIKNKSFLTVGVRDYKQQIPYGVVKSDDMNILDIEEKPINSCQINAGIYLADPSIKKYVHTDSHINMTDIILGAIREHKKVCKFNITDLWIDIGSMTDYILAQRHIAE